MTPSPTAAQFDAVDVRATYRYLQHAQHGVTEIRLIAGNGAGLRGIGYFDNEEDFVAVCAAVNGTANVYVGINPRPRRLFDQAPNVISQLRTGARDKDIEWLTTTVIDIDPSRPKNLAATDEELARAISCADALAERIAAKGFHAPIRHMSGNGCQVWFGLTPYQITPENFSTVTRQLKFFEARQRELFAKAGVKIDSIYNLSRVIKVIGTMSVKGESTAERPHRLSRSLDPFVRRDDAKLLGAILSTRTPPGPKTSSGTRTADSVTVGSALSKRVYALLDSNRSIAALYEGRGKPAIGRDGKRLDATSSGYDFSLAMKLAQKGIVDLGELATAIWHRPDGAARAKGVPYVTRTAAQALELASSLSGADRSHAAECIDFCVTRVVLRDSDPPYYHLTISGETLLLTSEQLLSPAKFRRRFMEALRRVPKLPGKKCPPWSHFVNLWLSRAEIQRQPEEASERGMLKTEIRSIIDDLGEADAADDLDRGQVLLVDGRRGFKTGPLARLLRERRGRDVPVHELCDVLRDLGCDYSRQWFRGKRVRVWLAPVKWPDGNEPEPHAADPEPLAPPELREPGDDGDEDEQVADQPAPAAPLPEPADEDEYDELDEALRPSAASEAERPGQMALKRARKEGE